MNKNYIEYNTKHWSKIKDSELALSKYKGLYEIDCNKTKFNNFNNCRVKYEFTNDTRGFLACTLSTAVISKPELNKYHSYGVLRHNI